MELTADRIRRLDAAAGVSEFPARDRAVVHAALYWGFTATELSLLPVQAVIQRNGDWQSRFRVPATFAFNGESRTAWLLDTGFIAILDDYIAFRREQEWCMGRPDRYRGLAPREPLFLNNRGQPFSMTPRSPGADDLLPTGMNRLLRELLDTAGLEEHSPMDFRDTTIVRLWDAGLTRQDIMTLTGIRRSETINRKIRDRIPPVEDVFRRFHRDLHAG